MESHVKRCNREFKSKHAYERVGGVYHASFTFPIDMTKVGRPTAYGLKTIF
jgi:hypothetical protein